MYKFRAIFKVPYKFKLLIKTLFHESNTASIYSRSNIWKIKCGIE